MFYLSPASARLKQLEAIEFGPRELLTGYTIRRHFEANNQRPNCCSAVGASMKGTFARSTEGENMSAQDADAIPSGTSGLPDLHEEAGLHSPAIGQRFWPDGS